MSGVVSATVPEFELHPATEWRYHAHFQFMSLSIDFLIGG